MSFYNDSTIAVQGVVAGKTMYVMVADVLGTWVVDIVEKQPGGGWGQMGWYLETFTMDTIREAGGPLKWIDSICQKMTEFLVKLYGAKPTITEADVKTLDDVRQLMRQTVELFDIGMRRK